MVKTLFRFFLEKMKLENLLNIFWDRLVLNLPGIPQPEGRVIKGLKKSDKTLLITICAPNWREVKKWGEFHFATSFGNEFRKYGFKYKIAVRSDWPNLPNNYDLHIHLRGLRRFNSAKKAKLSLLWIISHPDSFSKGECQKADLIFVASSRFTTKIERGTKKPVFFLPQATDPKIFFNQYDKKYAYPIIFIGNTREVFREVVRFTLNAGFDIKIWGRGWARFIKKQNICVGKYFPNTDLRLIYSSSHIILNDHWPDMKRWGFVNNRIFDVLACGGFVVSDITSGIPEILNQSVACYQSQRDFVTKIKHYLKNPAERKKLSKKGRNLVLKNHTFAHRVKFILEKIEKEHNKKFI